MSRERVLVEREEADMAAPDNRWRRRGRRRRQCATCCLLEHLGRGNAEWSVDRERYGRGKEMVESTTWLLKLPNFILDYYYSAGVNFTLHIHHHHHHLSLNQ